jgi:hypothetical protein
MERRLPAALWVTMIAGVLLQIGWWVLVREAIPRGATVRGFTVVSQARGLAASAMMLASLLLVRDVVARGPRRAALLAAAIAYGVTQLFIMGVLMWLNTGDRHGATPGSWYLQPMVWAGPLVRIAALGTIAAVGVRFDRPLTIVGLVVVLAAAVLHDTIPPLLGVLPGSEPWGIVLGVGLSAVAAAGAIALARLGVGGAGLGWRPAQGGLERAATAMAWRVGLGVSVVPLLFLAAEMRSLGLIKLILVGLPLSSAVAGTVSLLGLLAASRADATGAPRLRLATAAYTTALGAGLDLTATVIVWRAFGTDDMGDLVGGLGGALGYVMPAIALFGTLAFVSALDAITTCVPTGVTRDGLVTVGLVLSAVTGGGLWLQRAAGGSMRAHEVIAISLVISVAAIVTALSLVSMTRRIAGALGATPTVPVAIARDGA